MPTPKTLTPELLWALERVGAPSLSPDGAQAVVAVQRFDAANNAGASSLWLLSTLGGEPRRLTTSGEKDAAPSWSPSGEWIAFVAKRSHGGLTDAQPQLYVIAPDGGEAKRLTSLPGGVSSYKWLPSGKGLICSAWVYANTPLSGQAKAFEAHTARKDSAYCTEEAQYRHWDHNLPAGQVVHLLHVDVSSGAVHDLFAGSPYELARTEHDATHFDVSPSGVELAFVYDPAPQKLGSNCTSIMALRLPKKFGKSFKPEVRTLAEAKGWDHSAPSYSPSGGQLALLRAHLGKKHTMPNQLAVLELASGKLTTQVPAWDRTPLAPLRWLSDAELAFRAEDFGQTHLWALALGADAPTTLAKGGTVQAFDHAGGALVWAADAMDHPVRLHVRRAQEVKRIESFNDTQLAGVAMGRWESVTYTGALSDAPAFNAQGHTAQMWVIYPPGFDAAKKYPLLHAIHGGPHTASGDTFHYLWNNQAFAAQGYVVVCVNYHGSTSFGYRFMDSITHRWGELELQDVEAATDVMLKKRFIDKKRLFATGGSYGGYMVAWMNGHLPKNRYQAYVCHAGCWDWVGMFADDAWHWHAKELGAHYFDDMARVHAQSPHAHAQTLNTPTLVIHGQLDYRVPDAQGLAYYNTLKAQGVPARLVWYPDENHWILKRANALVWWSEFFDWLSRHDPAKQSAARMLKSPKAAKA